ncbi:MAG: hypothetical protein ACREBJ_02895 [Nitrosotalea sp.]
MDSKEKDNKIAFMTCVEVVLMRRGNTNYNLVLAKLQSYHNSWIFECVDNPEYLRGILREVYKNEYYSVVEEIRMESDRLEDMDKIKEDFLKIMLS